MIFKEDWEKAKERFNAFWSGEIVDRCCFAVTAPRNKPLDSRIELREAKDLVQRWTDSEFRLEEAMHYFSNNYFGGEAFPMFWNNLGPGVGASFMGSGYKLAKDTIWFDVNPIIKDWKDMPEIKLNKESAMWKIAWNMTEKFCMNGNGKYHVGITDLGGNFDIAVSLRGNDALLYDLYDYPEEVKALINQIDNVWFQAYDLMQGLLNKYVEGSSAWMGIWCKKRWYPLQCDFSAMISAEMFEKFVKLSLKREAEHMDYSIYHLDGPGQIRHLDNLLDIDGINGIQCVPGATLSERTGEFHSTFYSETWIPVYKKIQEKGKNLVLTEVHPSEIDDLLGCLSPKGLYIASSCKTENEARELLKKIEKWNP